MGFKVDLATTRLCLDRDEVQRIGEFWAKHQSQMGEFDALTLTPQSDGKMKLSLLTSARPEELPG